MKILIILLIGIFVVSNLSMFFFVLTNFHHFCFYGVKDIFDYIKKRKYNLFTNYGRIIMYTGSGSQVFGSGKTLSMIRDVISIYNYYDNKKVYDEENNKWDIQNIRIISNVELYGVPYIKFNNVNQFVDIDKYEFGEMDIVLYVLDESGAIFNSREFRNNISPEFLTTLLQSRKNKCVLYMTSQRLQFTDKILREICSTVVGCKKYWRIVCNYDYNPLDLEYALNPEIIRPVAKRYWFATDKTFKTYNTYQLVENLKKNYNANDFLSTEEILATYGAAAEGSKDNSTRIKKKYR